MIDDAFMMLHRHSPQGIAVPTAWGFDQEALAVAEMGVANAIVHALSKHGMPTTDPGRGVTNCTEELGEVAEAALYATQGGIIDASKLQPMCEELAQLAGYSILLIMSMRKLIRAGRG